MRRDDEKTRERAPVIIHTTFGDHGVTLERDKYPQL